MEGVFVVAMGFRPVDKYACAAPSRPAVKSGVAQKGSVLASLLRAAAVTSMFSVRSA